MNWRDVVTDPEEIKVFLALDAPDSTWRTFGGIARQSGLSKEYVTQILNKYSPKLVILSEILSISGQPLACLLEKAVHSLV